MARYPLPDLQDLASALRRGEDHLAIGGVVAGARDGFLCDDTNTFFSAGVAASLTVTEYSQDKSPGASGLPSGYSTSSGTDW